MTIFNVNETINEVFGTADKILDFFLRRKRVLAKYTKEESEKAIDLYIRYCKQATRVIKELGYPNKRHTLVSWYRGYEEKGEVKDDGREEKKLSGLRTKSQALERIQAEYAKEEKRIRREMHTILIMNA